MLTLLGIYKLRYCHLSCDHRYRFPHHSACRSSATHFIIQLPHPPASTSMPISLTLSSLWAPQSSKSAVVPLYLKRETLHPEYFDFHLKTPSSTGMVSTPKEPIMSRCDSVIGFVNLRRASNMASMKPQNNGFSMVKQAYLQAV
jgi:hypothetical protein